MEKKWTEAQLKAIETRGCDLLVSAGAGSGKTAVLTERIIRRLTDNEDPAEITRMLIVTFTKAAAGELRERISSAIADALANDPKNRRLSRQLLSLDSAKICTIHSFCLDLLKEAGTDAGLPADFRIADDAEIKLLRSSIMNDLIEDYHRDGVKEYPIPDFPEFADTFVGTKSDDGLAGVFLGLENDLSSFTEHIEFIKNFSDELRESDGDFAATSCGEVICSLIRGKLKYYREIFASVIPEIEDDEKLTKAYFAPFTADIEFIDNAVKAADSGCYDTLSSVFNSYSPLRLGVIRNGSFSCELARAKDVRREFSAERGKLAAKFFSLTKEQLDKNRLDTADTLDKLYNLLAAFVRRFEDEKRQRGIVDFGDLERLAYRLLINDGKPSASAEATSARFDEIYIDEYQDVNAVQDAIFAAVSNGRNRFMVGDIKQSIYAFRGAEPHIFADYRSRFSENGKPRRDDCGKAIFMQNNFRCDDTVINFSNVVSGCLFTSGSSGIPFTDDDLLIHSKSEAESGEPVHVVLIGGGMEDDSDEELCHDEAVYVAREVKRLIETEKKNDGTPIRPSDIAILMRSAKSMAESFEEAFRQYGIPLYNNVDTGFFENAEVLLALCILSIIDNPTKDIYLAGALKSPIFGFTLDELIMIRRHNAEGCLFDALRSYTEAEGFIKGRHFLDTLDKWRMKAEGLSVDRLVWYIYAETDLLALVYDSENSARRANLMLLYEYARRFEASSYKGLYNFIRYINDILEEKAQLETAKVFSESSDTVKLMTIHQSKGLEFPVCFICGTGKKFNESDLRANIIMERSLGIAAKLSDTTGFARYDTPIRQAIAKRLADSQLEEEMRVLYVAMTRARERLYVTAKVPDPEKLIDSAAEGAKHLSPYVILKNGGYIRWILTALEHNKLISDVPLAVTVEIPGELSAEIKSTDEPETAHSESEAVPDEDINRLIAERFGYVYPHSAASGIPAKLSVSKLVPNILDEDAAELEVDSDQLTFTEKRPKFLESSKDKAPTGKDRGTATHLFMQFCDFSRFTGFCDDIAAEVSDEAERLAERGFFTSKIAALINTDAVARFFEGEIFAEICASKKLYREHRFNVALPASDFTEDPEKRKALADETVLVQGVIDCFFENPDGTVTLIDYKTDYIPSGMSDTEAERMLLDRHRLQLTYYKEACQRISAKKVSRVQIYSFALNRAIEVI